MDIFDKLVQLQGELLKSQLKIIYRYQRQIPLGEKKIIRTSQLDIIEDILASSNKPLHISNILDIAQSDYNVTLERDSIVSALIKKIKAGKRFVKVAPNTFALKIN